MTEMIDTLINDRWRLQLPAHRAARPEWVTGWEPERVASMFANLEPGMVVFDIGTEEGDISALLARWANEWPAGGVVLIEPNPKAWPNTKAIWDANGLPDPLGWFCGFAASATEDGYGPDYEQRNWTGEVWPACVDDPLIGNHDFCHLWERPDIDKITLDDLADRLGIRPDVLTMDTEGSELRVVQGAERILAEDRPLVWISVHPEFSVQMYETTRLDLLRFMQARGYRCEWLAWDHEEHWLFWPAERDEPRDWRDHTG